MRLNRKGAMAFAVMALVILASGAAEAKTTAGQVMDDATLEAFVLGAKAEIEAITDVNEGARLRERLRTDGDWKSGSMFLIIFLPTGEPFIHGNDRTAESKNLLGVVDDNGLKVVEELLAAAARGGGFVKYQDGEPQTAYAVTYTSGITGREFVLVGGYSQDVSHVPVLIADLPKPAVTASQVVDRETLISFVEEAAIVYRQGVLSEGYRGLIGIRNAFRVEGGNWKSGSIYLWVVSGGGIILFHATEPFREGRPTDLTRTDINGVRFAEELIEGARREGRKFVQYYYDDPTIEGDEDTGSPKLGYAVSFSVPNSPQKAVIGSGIYIRPTGPIFVPVVLSAAGKYASHFTSELALTNRDSEPAILNYTYTAHQGGGSGTATDMLGPNQQKIETNAIEYLRGLEVPIPETGKRIGTLRVDVSSSSDTSVVVRTTTPTAVPEGHAGLAYPGIPGNEGFGDEVVYLCGLREHPGDRSNVAVQNMGSEGSITLRTTVYSGDPADPIGEMLNDMTLGPGEFHQFNAVLRTAGKSGHIGPTFGGGYVKVERVEGTAPFYAYGVINDNANSDGSFVFPVSAGSLEGAMGLTLPALVEINQFTTELTLTNFSAEPKVLMFSATHERIEAENNTAGFGPLPMLPGQQLIIPNALASARQTYQLDVPTNLVAPLQVQAVAGDLSGVVIGARVVAQADPEDTSRGQYGVFYTAVPHGQGFTTSAWVDGLQQNEENRSNLALINTGEVGGSASVFELDIYDGETAMLVKTVTMDEEDKLVVPAKGFRQINDILRAHAPGTTQGYVEIRKVSGANPFLAYGVVNDGGSPGERTSDGAYMPARE